MTSPETLRLYASILRKPVRNSGSCSGRPPFSDHGMTPPSEIMLAAADALDFRAAAIEAEQNAMPSNITSCDPTGMTEE